MGKNKWLISIVAVFMLAAVVLSACSSANNGGASSSPPASSDPSKPASGASQTPSEPAAPARTITVMRSDTAIQPLLKDSPALQEIMKHTNTKINIQGVPEGRPSSA